MKIRKNLAFILLAVLLVAAIAGTSVAYMFRQTDKVENQFKPATVSCEVYEENGKIHIKNTGSIDAYLRIRIVVYWVNRDNGDIQDKPSPDLELNYDQDNWIKGLENTYYYKTAVEPDKSVVLSDPIAKKEDPSDNTKWKVHIFGEAIQSQPANAAQSAWGVIIDGSGDIEGIAMP